MNEKQEILKRLSNIRCELVRAFPFYSRMLLRLPFGLGEVGTAGTDGKMIVFDQRFLSRITDREVRFLLLHELYHVLLKHVSRGEKYAEHRLVHNVACDIVINSLIIDQLGLEADFEIDGETVMHTTPCGNEGYLFTSDEVFEILMRYAGQRGRNPYVESFHFVDSHDGWDAANIIEPELQHDINDMLKRMKACGNTNHHLIRQLHVAGRNKDLDWKKALRIFASGVKRADEDFSYMKPNRRFLDCDFIVPGWAPEEFRRAEEYDGIEFFVDVSGSITDRELTQFMDEVSDCLKQVCLQGELCFFDTEVIQNFPITSGEELSVSETLGSGGTSFHCVFEYVEKLKQKPRGIVVLTDGYASFPAWEDVRHLPPVLWVITSSVLPPWGKYVEYHGEE